ncbi:MAG: hypothetical protein KDC83_12030 [Flavobacteriales bacterium]|nr:hypothetical protein [Flavobacteriales bacterium]
MSRNYKFNNPEGLVYSSIEDYAGENGLLENIVVLDKPRDKIARERG